MQEGTGGGQRNGGRRTEVSESTGSRDATPHGASASASGSGSSHSNGTSHADDSRDVVVPQRASRSSRDFSTGKKSPPRNGPKGATPKRGRWSQAEIARLKEYYGLRDLATIARDLNRPIPSVRRMAADVFRQERRTGPWSADEVQRLKRYLGRTDEATIALILARTEEEVRQRIAELDRVQTRARWTRPEVSEFKKIYGTRTDEDLARVFGRPVEAISQLASELKLAKDKGFLRKLNGASATKMPRWTDEELALLEELYPKLSNLEIATQLARSVKSVVSKAHNMGLRKDPARLREMGRENVSLRYRSS